ncbi:RWP-RK domain containing protein [Parasponia andersonii]|uniref:RWP-RK domain containing protein n=1 Tax=Parasponia andersonii TaxID=3476 RepID=A0A2P5BMN4_PARAD|nr:RWP-RK domain containing protein [Parasponia andersonii]
MDSSKTHFLLSLLIFKNTINRELIRSLHVYRLINGMEKEVEREFVFSVNGAYVEMEADPLLRLQKFEISEVFEGFVNGLWLCIFAFYAHHPPPPLLTCIPSLLTLSRNPKLRAIPSLANDLETIFHMICVADDKEPSRVLSERTCQRNNQNHHQLRRNVPVLDQDLNCLPYPVTPSELSDDQQIEQSSSGTMEKKKKRATSKDIARIALSDLAKYFDLPIVEASRNLEVGLTVLKKKCREFGIPRWPHRKIKSLDSLIRDLQEEREWQQQDNKAAAIAVAKRQSMLENERESIEKKPFLEMKTETKRFRQDVFKRKHRARVLGTQSLFLPDN